jgi:hypothetical protein
MPDTNQDETTLLRAIEDHDVESFQSLTFNRDSLWGRVTERLSPEDEAWAIANLPE